MQEGINSSCSDWLTVIALYILNVADTRVLAGRALAITVQTNEVGILKIAIGRTSLYRNRTEPKPCYGLVPRDTCTVAPLIYCMDLDQNVVESRACIVHMIKDTSEYSGAYTPFDYFNQEYIFTYQYFEAHVLTDLGQDNWEDGCSAAYVLIK